MTITAGYVGPSIIEEDRRAVPETRWHQSDQPTRFESFFRPL